jgi:hypothetical protein
VRRTRRTAASYDEPSGADHQQHHDERQGCTDAGEESVRAAREGVPSALQPADEAGRLVMHHRAATRRARSACVLTSVVVTVMSAVLISDAPPSLTAATPAPDSFPGAEAGAADPLFG